ncbi:syntaxin-8-like [Eriocheir sinensis]|uniref:syntaxin-8-like n=1 Tax=Eriocheir sinensis TaxID=95602 RepID=UPI0021C57DE2|nr:syntaxin-8-like [Eriocheir sinensis]
MPAEDRWLTDYSTVEGVVRDVTETVTKRRQAGVGTVQHALLSNKLRTAIPQVDSQVSDLISRLDSWELRDITPAERERRTRLCERLQSTIKKAHMDFTERKEPVGRGAGGSVGWGWGVEDDDDDGEASRPLTTSQMREDQQRLLREQEDGLEALSGVVSQQRRIASAIGTEVVQQNELLDDVTQRTDNTRNRLVDETENITTTTQKSRTWPYWLVIAGLLAAIVIVLVW